MHYTCYFKKVAEMYIAVGCLSGLGEVGQGACVRVCVCMRVRACVRVRARVCVKTASVYDCSFVVLPT